MSTYVGIYLHSAGQKNPTASFFLEDFILNNLEKKRLGKDRMLSDAGKEEFFM